MGRKDSQSRASPNPSGGRRFAATSARDNFVYIALKAKGRQIAHASHKHSKLLQQAARARDPDAAAMATVSAAAATTVVARAAIARPNALGTCASSAVGLAVVAQLRSLVSQAQCVVNW
jgi:hypothetical protein